MTGKKSWFAEHIIDLGSNKEQKPSATPQVADTTSYSVPTTTAASTPTAPVAAGIPEDIKQFFAKIWEDSNIPAPDYKEFMESLNEMKNEDIPEATKYRMLFKTFKASKVTPARLVETANVYLKVFSDKKEGFEKSVREKSAGITSTKQKEADELAARELSIKEQLEKLNAELTETKLKKEQTVNEIAAATTKYTQRLADFQAMYTATIDGINNTVASIQKYSA